MDEWISEEEWHALVRRSEDLVAELETVRRRIRSPHLKVRGIDDRHARLGQETTK